jgi:hypothetical protein
MNKTLIFPLSTVRKAVVASLWLLAFSASAQEPEFCAWAQQVIAQTEEIPAVQVHETRESFIESKAFDEPFTVQQYWSTPVGGEDGMPTVVSCKMRTAERINAAHAPGAVPVAGGDLSCEVLHQQMLASAYATIPAAEQTVPRQQWVVDEEDMTYMGPKWLEPWPFKPLARGEGGSLHLQTRALYVPMAWWIPMPDRFLGNYYCHLIAPDYLRALVRGEHKPGV